MNRLALLVALSLVLPACSKKEEEGKTWPGAISVSFEPALGADQAVKPEQTVKVRLANKTGEQVAFEWKSKDECGTLKTSKEQPALAEYTAGKHGEDCAEEITILATGKKIDGEKKLTLTVKGDPKFKTLELRPNPLPETWVMVNDYESTFETKSVSCKRFYEVKEGDKKVQQSEDVSADFTLNKLGGVWNTWGWENGGCSRDVELENAEKGVLALHYDLPGEGDYCGFYEDLKARPENCDKTEKMDLSDVDYITFLAKTGDGKPRTLRLELVIWEEFADANQGASKAAPNGFEVTGEWRRFEVAVNQIIKDDPSAIKTVKQLSFRVNREKGQPDEGFILIDNVALIKKAAN